MKKLLLFFFALLVFPISAFAKDTCDSNDIKIQSISLVDSTGHIEEISNASISNQKINLGLKMDVVGDSAEYKIVVKNNSLEDYYFDESALNIDKESVNYEVSFDDNTNFIKGGEEKIIYLKISYREQMNASNLDNGIYNGNQVVKLNIMTFENPFTGRFLGLLIFISLVVGFFILYKDRKMAAYLLLLISFVIPFSVSAVCKHSLEVNANFVIDAKEAIFLPGNEMNVKMKQLAGDDLSGLTNPQIHDNLTITSIEYSEVEPINTNKEEKNIVSTPDSQYPIYMWFDNGVIYWWSEDKTPALNENSRAFFLSFLSLQTIDGLSNIDTSNVTDLSYFFANNTSLLDVSPVYNWNVEKVNNMNATFNTCLTLEEIDLSKWKTSSLESFSNVFGMWEVHSNAGDLSSKLKRIILSERFDTSKVTNMYALLANNTHIEDYSFLRYLDVSNVTNLAQFFQFNLGLTNTEYINGMDVSSATSMRAMFHSCINLINVDLSNWHTDSLVDMSLMFYRCFNISEMNISNFNVSNVETMHYAFNSCQSLSSLNLRGWNTPKLTDLSNSFYGMNSLEELDISTFDTSKVTNFSKTFSASVKLNHIYVGEKWDTSANIGDTKDVFPSTCNLPNFSNTNPDYRDLSYAHTGEGGYLTLKTD